MQRQLKESIEYLKDELDGSFIVSVGDEFVVADDSNSGWTLSSHPMDSIGFEWLAMSLVDDVSLSYSVDLINIEKVSEVRERLLNELNGMSEGVNIIDGAVEKISVDLKAMLEATKDDVSVYVVDRKSSRFVIRKVGYAGFTVVYAFNKVDQVISVKGYSQTPERVQIYINNWGELQETEREFYVASHAYSWQEHGFYNDKIR